jgi:hypothetical protein
MKNPYTKYVSVMLTFATAACASIEKTVFVPAVITEKLVV